MGGFAWFLVEVAKMSRAAASAYVISEVAVALGWLEGVSWVLNVVVVASLGLFASFEDLLHSIVDADFILTRLCVISADLDRHCVALLVGAGSVAVVASSTACSPINMKALSDGARAHKASISVGAIVLASSVVHSAFVDILAAAVLEKVVSS